MAYQDEIKPELMYWTIVNQDNGTLVTCVCGSCLLGEHNSYSIDHRIGEEGRQGCKNIDPKGIYQCSCNPEWPELYDMIENQTATLFGSKEDAKNSIEDTLL